VTCWLPLVLASARTGMRGPLLLSRAQAHQQLTREGKLRRMARSFLRQTGQTFAAHGGFFGSSSFTLGQHIEFTVLLNSFTSTDSRTFCKADPATSFQYCWILPLVFPPDRKSRVPDPHLLQNLFGRKCRGPSPTCVLLFHRSSRCGRETAECGCDHWCCRPSLRRPMENHRWWITSAITSCKQSVRLSDCDRTWPWGSLPSAPSK